LKRGNGLQAARALAERVGSTEAVPTD